MDYNSLQAQLEKRLGNGLQLFSSYTWSKWMGLCCDENGDNQPEVPIPHRNYSLTPDDRKRNATVLNEALYQRGAKEFKFFDRSALTFVT